MNLIQTVQAASDSLVACSGGDCGVCSLLTTTVNIYNYIILIGFSVAIAFLILAGFAYIFSVGRKSFMEKAKGTAKKAFIGFALILAGWLILKGAISAVGYQNAGSWWQFQCVDESENVNLGTQKVGSDLPKADYLSSLKTYSQLSSLVNSQEKAGIITSNFSADSFLTQLKSSLPENQEIVFSVPAKLNSVNKEETVLVPFLAGYSSNGQLKIDTTALSDNLGTYLGILAGDPSYSNLSLLDQNNQTLTSSQKKQILNNLTDYIGNLTFDSLRKSGDLAKMGLSDVQNFSDLKSNPQKIDQAIAALTQTVDSLEAQNPKNTFIEQTLSGLTAKVKENAVLVAEVNDRSNATNSGDRTEKTATDNSKTDNNQSTDKTQVDPNSWQKSMSNSNAPTGSKTDDFGKISDGMDKINKDQGGTSDLDPGDWNNGDGSRQAILKALKRIANRDQFRYEMIFRFVAHIGDNPEGGLCDGCGSIYVTHKDKIINIAHFLVHEGTHSGQFCLNKMGGFSRGQIEAIACANQIGSLETTQSHKNMKEFDEGKKNRPEVTYKSGSGQTSGQVRGHLARYWTENQPRGDLNTSILEYNFKAWTDYPIKNGYMNQGDYHYGFCSGQPKYLQLKQAEENIVKEIVTSKAPCKSSPPKELIKEKELYKVPACEGAPEIQID